MNFREIGWKGVEWIQSGSGYGLVAGCCEHGNEPSNCGGEFID
jgi:hypothetical protein